MHTARTRASPPLPILRVRKSQALLCFTLRMASASDISCPPPDTFCRFDALKATSPALWASNWKPVRTLCSSGVIWSAHSR